MIKRQLNIEYIRVVALFVLQKLDLKNKSNVLQTSERQLFWKLIYVKYLVGRWRKHQSQAAKYWPILQSNMK